MRGSMVEKLDEFSYKCGVCGRLYEKRDGALKCEQDHDIVYVKFKREDLFRLLQFIMTKDETLLSKSLISTLNKYNKGYYK